MYCLNYDTQNKSINYIHSISFLIDPNLIDMQSTIP